MTATGATMHEPGIRARRPWADPVLVAMAAVTVAALPWFWFARSSSAVVSSWLLQVGLDFLTATFAVRLSRATAGSRHARRFWRAVTLAGASCTIGDGYQTVRTILNPHETNTSVIQTAFVVLGMSAVVLTMLAHPLGGTGRQRLRLWLDAATVLTGIAVFLWYFSLAPVLTGERPQRYAGAATCAVMLLIAFALIKLVMSGSAPFSRAPAVLGCIGVAGTAVGSTLVTMLTGSDDPRLMFFIQLVPCVLTTGSLRLQEVLTVSAPTSPSAPRRSSRLPYLAVVVTQVLLVVVLLNLHADMRVWGVAAGTLAITILVVGRQLAAFHDNERLLIERDNQREWFRSLVQHSSDVTLVVGADGRVRYASPAGSRVLGVDPSEIVGTLLGAHALVEDRPLLDELFARLAATPGVDANAQLRMRHNDGTLRWLDIVGADLSDNPSVDGIVLNARDITEARALHDELRHQATHDGLTGLGNRTLLDQKLRGTAPEQTLGILLVDLDGFKPINDERGHHAGDQVLIAVAHRLAALAGATGSAIRLGGDEFAVLLPGATLPAAESLASLITEALAEPIPLPGSPVQVGASVGAASGHATDAEQLLRAADAAMYRAKADRRTHANAR
ncbi:diguanylate cyclase domain-containing protein [Actinoplanes sp. NPDC051343]|uniref:diguanylate cyclase domain-containing protein n=1 Tax=Actinoplanes sp. NPDC051343 TaxID=3363906 RepID=UPI0037A5AFB6